MQHHYAEAVPSHGAVFSEHCHFHVSHDERSHIVRALPGHWQGRLGIEPTQAVLETASPALEHSPLYPAFTDSSRSLIRVLSNARFNAGKSNGPSRSQALLTGHNARQVWACRNIAPVRCQLWDLVQTAGLEPAHTSGRGALPIELRLRMSPLGHIVEKCEESCHFCPQLPAPKGGLSREEETDEKAEA